MRWVLRARVGALWGWLYACAAAREPAAGPSDAGKPAFGDVHIRVLDDAGEPMRCKLLLTAAGTRLALGPPGMIGAWLTPSVLATDLAVYGDPCDLTLRLPAEPVQLQASAGMEWDLAGASVTARASEPTSVELRMTRALDTSGYACVDLHVHSAPSFDSDVPLDQRIVTALAEGLDAIAPTDHDAIGDWDAEVMRLGVADDLTILLGAEVTPDIWSQPQALGHFGMFPVPDTFDPAQYQLSFQTPGSLLERLDTLYPESLIQVNHPRWDSIGYFNVGGYDPADPTLDKRLGLSHLDAIELWNSHQVDVTGGPAVELMLNDFYTLLDLGFSLVATGNTDTHELSRHPLGYPRNCVRVANDQHPGLTPDGIHEGLRLGRVLVTSGPWLEVALNGHGPGDWVDVASATSLDVSVDAASWVSVDRVHIVVNGRTATTIPTRSLPAHLEVPLELSSAVSYIMVIAEGDAPLPSVAGELSAPQRSFAFTNPLWVRTTP
jgi:hypothetical protein